MSTARTATAQKTATPTITAVPTRILQRQCDCGAHAAGGECEDCKKQKGVLSRKASGHGASDTSAACEMSAMSPRLVAEALRSPGQPLDRDTRAFMESRFQHDFSAVRVHTDARAAASARALRARAWALGSDVAFATGAYAPGTATGRRLLAHELTHVVQQERAPASAQSPDTELNVSEPGDASEREADRVADHVAESSPLVVRSQAAPEVIHRDWWDDLSGWEKAGVIGGSVAGAVGLVAFFRWLANRKGPEDIDNEPQCGPRQDKVILPVLSRAKQWLVRATGRVRAFRARPRDPANRPVDLALNRRFRSTDPAVVEKVERVLVRTHAALWQITRDGDSRQCHTTKHAQCDNSGKVRAFASRGISRINFCRSFFTTNESEAAEIVIHEVTHSLVGGAAIHDRAYLAERRFGGGPEPNRLNTEENLTNAESYASFVADLATGEVFGQPPPADVVECPANWQDPVKDTLSLVQRADIRFLSALSQENPPPQEALNQKWSENGRPGNPPPVEVVKRAILAVIDALSHPIHIVCNPDAAARCRDGDVEWDAQAQARTITLCAGWLARDQRTRTASILAGLYGWVGAINNRVWRTALAEIAIDTARDPQFAPAAHDDVFGRVGWTPALLRVEYIPYYPLTRRPFYFEAGGGAQLRMSTDMPSYTQTDCHASTLTLSFQPRFLIDVPPVPRPGPYTRPRLWVKYTHPSREWEAADTNAIPSEQPGAPVDTFLSRQAHRVKFDANGTFAVEIGLHDPDSGVTRTYRDQIMVEPVLACPDAISGADPATPPRHPKEPPQ